MYTNQNFGDALAALKDGLVVFRKGWNGAGQFAYFVPPASYPAQTGVAKSFFGEGAMVPYGGYFALKTADGTVNTWVPSVSDLLAHDWAICRAADLPAVKEFVAGDDIDGFAQERSNGNS